VATMPFLAQIKNEYLPTEVQVIIFTPNGFLVDSCNTYFDMEKHRSESLFKALPFLQDHHHFIKALTEKTPPRIINAKEVVFDEKPVTIDAALFKRESMIILVFHPSDSAAILEPETPVSPISLKDEVIMLRAELEKLKQTRKIKSEYFHKIAHDIKLPLTEIVGTTYLLQNFVQNEKGHEYLKVLSQSAITLDKMLKDLLEFSRLEATDIPFDKKPFSIEQVLWSVVKAYDYTCDQKNVPLYLRIDKKLPAIVIGDPERLSQIIYNLIDNAVKFTENGSIEVLVNSLNIINNESCEVEFKVSDTGIGIHQSKMSKIFEAYHQVDEVENSKKGFGLGLSIVRQLVELQGGSVSVHSVVGEGTTFTVKIIFAIYNESEN
jgi:signal transduction histidine kinase